jgi:hypothetical protein
VQEAFHEAEERIVDAWRFGETTEAREEAWYRLQALGVIEKELRIFSDDGQVAEESLRREGEAPTQ